MEAIFFVRGFKGFKLLSRKLYVVAQALVDDHIMFLGATT